MLDSDVDLLDCLEEILDDIEAADNEWEYNFVSNLLIQRDEGYLDSLTEKQREKANELITKYG